MWLTKLIDGFFAPINAVGSKFSRSFDHSAKINCYELQGDRIIKWKSRRRNESVDVGSIERWRSIPEMVFDIVQIELKDGATVQWLDTYNDLLEILWRVAAEKRYD